MTDRHAAVTRRGQRLPSRTNTSTIDATGWVIAMVVLVMVVTVNGVIAANGFFLTVHGASPLLWLAIQVGILAAVWLIVALALHLAHRLGPTVFDVTASALTLAVFWFLTGTVIVRAVPGTPETTWVVTALWFAGLPIAAGLVLLSRRFAMGSVLLACATIAAVLPLAPGVANAAGGGGLVRFADSPDRPSVVWIVADELQYQLVFDETGAVRPQFPALRELQEGATTYTRAFTPANSTEVAVPAMMAGIADVTVVAEEDLAAARDQDGVLPGFGSVYAEAWSSPLFGPDCTDDGCDGVPDGTWARLTGLVRDGAVVAGNVALAPPLRDRFPPLTGKWRDFTTTSSTGGHGRSEWPGIVPQLRAAAERDPQRPVFAFWHDMGTHVPWFRDLAGEPIYPPGLPDIDAIDVGYTRQGEVTTPELTVLQRRLYAAAAVDFDRRLAALLDELSARSMLDRTMVIVTSDHGAAVGQPRREATSGLDERRVGATPEQAWEEIAHVPLIVKYPGQHDAVVVSRPRSTAQVLPTVLEQVDAQATTSWPIAPPLAEDLPGDPTFTLIAGPTKTAVPYRPVSGTSLPLDADLVPTDARYPFAVGLPPSMLGTALPPGWIPIQSPSVQSPDGTSDQRLLVVTRSARECSATDRVGAVTIDDTVVGSILWEQDGNAFAADTRGWAIVPTSDTSTYGFWCRPPAA